MEKIIYRIKTTNTNFK